MVEVAQPKKIPVRVTDLHDKCISVQVWDREKKREDGETVKIKLWIQRQTGVDVKNWNGPEINAEQLQKQNMAMVAIWMVDEDSMESSNKYHAVYVKKCSKLEGMTDLIYIYFEYLQLHNLHKKQNA